jgi:hypothetical protein
MLFSISLRLNYFRISFVLVISCIHAQIITQDLVSHEIFNYILVRQKAGRVIYLKSVTAC